MYDEFPIKSELTIIINKTEVTAMQTIRQIYNILQKLHITQNVAGSTEWMSYNHVLFSTPFTKCGPRQGCLGNKMKSCAYISPSKT